MINTWLYKFVLLWSKVIIQNDKIHLKFIDSEQETPSLKSRNPPKQNIKNQLQENK